MATSNQQLVHPWYARQAFCATITPDHIKHGGDCASHRGDRCDCRRNELLELLSVMRRAELS